MKPGGVFETFYLPNSAGSTMAVGSTQALKDWVPGIFPDG
jgi:hypothetical protein